MPESQDTELMQNTPIRTDSKGQGISAGAKGLYRLVDD